MADRVMRVALAIVLLALLPLVLGYLIHERISRQRLRRWAKRQVRTHWWPKGKYVFFLYSDSEKWKAYFEENLIPQLQSVAHVWNWSTRQRDGWDEDPWAKRILQAYRPRAEFFPLAVVFRPDGEVRTFALYQDYVKWLKSDQPDYLLLEADLLAEVEALRALPTER